jgi:hypothetical protein
MKNQIAVFEFGREFNCTEFYDVDINSGGIEIKEDNKYLGSIIGLSIPDIDDEDETEKFNNEVIDWIVDNDK